MRAPLRVAFVIAHLGSAGAACTAGLSMGPGYAVRRSGEPPDFVPGTFAPPYEDFESDDLATIAVLRTEPLGIPSGYTVGPSGWTLAQFSKALSYLEPGDVVGFDIFNAPPPTDF